MAAFDHTDLSSDTKCVIYSENEGSRSMVLFNSEPKNYDFHSLNILFFICRKLWCKSLARIGVRNWPTLKTNRLLQHR